jgi:hypothetical protein
LTIGVDNVKRFIFEKEESFKGGSFQIKRQINVGWDFGKASPKPLSLNQNNFSGVTFAEGDSKQPFSPS